MLRCTTLFAVAAAVIAGGCGQVSERDGTAAPAAPSGPTKHAFIARADAICERMVARAKGPNGTSTDEAFARALALQRGALKELRALTPPRGDERSVQAVLLHLGRLQQAMAALERTEGEEVLAVVAAIGFEMDAVARAANRYGLFRDCNAWSEIPQLRRSARGHALARGFRVRPSVRRAAHPTVRSPEDLRRLASELVPAGRSVLNRQNCASVDPVGAPTCVTIELTMPDQPLAARRAELAAGAARAGWTQLKASNGKQTPGLLVLHRNGYDATVWLARPDCTPRLQVGDGPSPKARTGRCVDTILVMSS